MKNCIVFCLFVVLSVALGRPEEKYTDKYDNINVDEIIGNKRLIASFVKCALETGPCTTEALELKSHIKDALENKCGKCTEVQKKEVRHVIGFLINDEPQYWQELTEKYDPSKKYVTLYEHELKKVKAQ